MKTFLGILLSISSISCFGQFPEPTNFEFNYEYIMIDDAGYCAGQYVYGPTYCSHFTWNAPDTLTTNAKLEYYNLYFYNYYSQDTTILATTTDLYLDMEIGIIGEVWVTAVYSNPDGESDSSNVVINESLPISVQTQELKELNMIYDNQSQQITILNAKDISTLNIYNSQGKLIKSGKPIDERISISQFQKGLYIIELVQENQQVKRLKIIK